MNELQSSSAPLPQKITKHTLPLMLLTYLIQKQLYKPIQIMLRKGTQPHLKPLKDLDLNTIDKPKTLVVLHYNKTRISVPLFKQLTDIADLLYHHISTLQKQILNSNPDWQKKAQQQIVCFQIKKENNQKLSDGDLRSNILMSLLRIKGEQQIQELSFKIDMTKVYKYIEVEPFYRVFEKEQGKYQHSQRAPYLSFQRIIHSGRNSNIYLARRINDGYFFGVKIFSQGSRVGLSQSKVVEHMVYIDQQGSNIKSNLLVRSQIIAFIPHPETQSSEEQQNAQSCRHVALIYPYFVRGNLQELLHQTRFGRKRISQMDCLNYLKELMWGMHILHEKYNLVHRALSPANLHLDQNGQLKLVNFAFSVPCYDSKGQFAQYCPKTKYPKSGYSLQQLLQEQQLQIRQYSAPELLHGQFYNYLVDFYSIGMIIKKMYEQSQVMESTPVNQNNQNLMISMIQKLTSSDIGQRSQIVHQILEDIAREQMEEQIQVMPLTLQDIKVGINIENISHKKFIQNQDLSNGIDHQIVCNFFKEPLRPKLSKIKKQRKLSKEKASGKYSGENSRSKDKNQKSHSKLSNTSQPKKRKVSTNKNKSFNSSHEPPKDSRQKHPTQKNIARESPVPRKTNKSRSQQRKKDPLTCTKLYTYNDEQKRPVVIPKSPKGGLIHQRTKSPAIRQR